MTRNGIGTLIRNGPAPGRAGISHLARNEMVVPNAAMQRDPSLRRHAMMSMARMGRDPAQYMVGSGRNSRNPRTGAAEYADMIYTENGWVDPSSGAPVDFSQSQDSYANTGTTVAPQSYPSFYDPATNAVTYGGFAGFQGRNQIPAGTQAQLEDTSPQMQLLVNNWDAASNPNSNAYSNIVAQQNWEAPTTSPFQTAASQSTGPTLADFIQAQQPQQPAASTGGPTLADFAPWSSPQTYDQWRDTRNPAGKNVQNTLFGQTTGAGYSLPSTPLTMGADQYAGQMPVGNPVPWSIPGTALGFGAENTGTDPSILNNGYQSNINSAAGYGSFMPNALAGLFGGGNQNGGIAFSGASGQPYGQPYGGTGAGDFRAPFRY